MKAKPRAKKSLGQHFLANYEYCQKIIKFSQISSHDTVVEIGPGTGQLTDVLLPLARRVVAIELDRDLIKILKERYLNEPKTSNVVEIIQADILSFKWSTLGNGPFKIIGNLPYNIATRILQSIIDIKDRFRSGTFLLQKEVAQRILSSPNSKDYGYFTLLMEYHFERTAGFDVPSGVFSPPPKVISQVIQLTPRTYPHAVNNEPAFRTLIKNAFQQRRKTLWNNLKFRYKPRQLQLAFKTCHVSLQSRPEELTLKQYVCLGQMLYSPPS